MTAALDLLLRSIPILIGGGVVQLVIFLLRRRAEVRQLDAATAKTDEESDAIAVSSAAQSLTLAGIIRDQALAQVAALQAELDRRVEQTKVLAEQAATDRRRLGRAEADAQILRHQVEGLTEEVEQLREEVAKLSHRDDTRPT